MVKVFLYPQCDTSSLGKSKGVTYQRYLQLAGHDLEIMGKVQKLLKRTSAHENFLKICLQLINVRNCTLSSQKWEK